MVKAKKLRVEDHLEDLQVCYFNSCKNSIGHGTSPNSNITCGGYSLSFSSLLTAIAIACYNAYFVFNNRC